MQSFREWLNEKEGKESYQIFFKKKLEKFGVKSVTELSVEDKKKFFNEVDAEWEGEKEEPESGDVNEALKVNADAMSAELSINTEYGRETSQISIWVNAGTAYRYIVKNSDIKQIDKLTELSNKERVEIANGINKKVEKLISSEIEKLIK